VAPGPMYYVGKFTNMRFLAVINDLKILLIGIKALI
jgi:hypothetical protein